MNDCPYCDGGPCKLDPDPERTKALGRQWLEGYRDGFNQGSAIASDLIAACWATADEPDDWHRVEKIFDAADRAEARLREVTGDE